MSLHENVSDCFASAVRFQEALAEIARGRTDNGRPLGGERARQIAREALLDRGRDWSPNYNDGEDRDLD